MLSYDCAYRRRVGYGSPHLRALKAAQLFGADRRQREEMDMPPHAATHGHRLAEFSYLLAEVLSSDDCPARALADTVRRGPRSASSQFRGVTKHRRTKRWESHIWYQRQQRYLGGFGTEMHAGKAHDVMALKCRGCHGPLNFPLGTYSKLLPYLDDIHEDELVATLRQLNKDGRIVDQRSEPTGRAPPAAIDIHHQGLVQQTLLWPPQWESMKADERGPVASGSFSGSASLAESCEEQLLLHRSINSSPSHLHAYGTDPRRIDYRLFEAAATQQIKREVFAAAYSDGEDEPHFRHAGPHFKHAAPHAFVPYVGCGRVLQRRIELRPGDVLHGEPVRMRPQDVPQATQPALTLQPLHFAPGPVNAWPPHGMVDESASEQSSAPLTSVTGRLRHSSTEGRVGSYAHLLMHDAGPGDPEDVSGPFWEA